MKSTSFSSSGVASTGPALVGVASPPPVIDAGVDQRQKVLSRQERQHQQHHHDADAHRAAAHPAAKAPLAAPVLDVLATPRRPLHDAPPRVAGPGPAPSPRFSLESGVRLTALATAGPDRYRWVVTDLRRAVGGPSSGIRQAWRSNRNVARAAWGVCAATALAAGAALVLLHAWIFWDQLASGRLLEGASALRWTSAVTLCAVLDTLRRRGVSLWWGRQAFCVWLLVALLHAWSASPATAGTDMASRDPANQAAATFLVPVTALALASLVGLLLIWWSHTAFALGGSRILAAEPHAAARVLVGEHWARASSTPALACLRHWAVCHRCSISESVLIDGLTRRARCLGAGLPCRAESIGAGWPAVVCEERADGG